MMNLDKFLLNLQVRRQSWFNQVIGAFFTLIYRLAPHKNTFSWSLKWLAVIGWLFRKQLSELFSFETSRTLSREVVRIDIDDREDIYIVNRLANEFIKYLCAYATPKRIQEFFADITELDKSPVLSKLLLLTHSGDYWVSVYKICKMLENTGSTIVIPIYVEVNDVHLNIQRKLGGEGMTVSFISIHKPGALKSLVRYIKDNSAYVVLFFDLSSKVGGVYNGSVDATLFFGRKGYMTLGVMDLAIKLGADFNIVTCSLDRSISQYDVIISKLFHFDDVISAKQAITTYLEETIRRDPTQWQFLAYLDTYFHTPYFNIVSHDNHIEQKHNEILKKYKP